MREVLSVVLSADEARQLEENKKEVTKAIVDVMVNYGLSNEEASDVLSAIRDVIFVSSFKNKVNATLIEQVFEDLQR